ncbi:MAG TPA: PAS domain S-box protein [Oleiagrimonas sp.]|nr:PAS domain S-box protein [Oleiagrimonas sp.]HET8554434.1 PAS domain S-box protein [Rhodanobacteraceae bacterium]
MNTSAPAAAPLIVGIGASAGGLEAFKTFFAHMPADSGMAFVLVQHLAPEHKSMLAELLQRGTDMPVAEAEDGAEVAPNHVFVIPPNATLTIEHGRLGIDNPAPARAHRRPIDTFFGSLAEDQGENAVGIVLSGTGSDGSLGVRAIKEHGGLTLAQAEFDSHAQEGMPYSAAATGLVDYVLQIAEMPAKLADYRRHLATVADRKGSDGARRDAADHLQTICRLLRERIGHDFSEYKTKTLTRRIQRRMQVLQIDSVPDYIERLKAEPRQLELLFHELLIGVTRFFRDSEAWDALQQTVLPQLFKDKGASDTLRVWVPGCATGEEAWSVAMLLREAMSRREEPNPKVQIFGTDIDDGAVAMARSGRYHKPMPGLSPERLERWFVEDGDGYVPGKALREICIFSPHSLVKDPPFSKLDLICCRNLLIYLQPALQDRVLAKFHYALKPGGWLFLGQAEGVSRNAKLFGTIDKKHRLYRRSDQPTPPLSGFISSPGRSAAAPAHPSAGPVPRAGDERLDRDAREALEAYSPAWVIIDRHQEILRFSGGETRRYLEPSPGAASFNLLGIARKTLRPALRAAVRQAFADGRPVVRERVTLKTDGGSRAVTLIVKPLDQRGSELAVVAFRDEGVHDHDGTAPVAADAGNAELEQELHVTKVQLNAAISELESTNEEMKSANEEYQSVNEELQSSNEELETSKEEMQSMNEELQTVNAELISKNNDLSRANSDVQNFLDSTRIATVFLDRDLCIRNFTPDMKELFHLRESDLGRPITELAGQLQSVDLKRDVEKVLRTLAVTERDVIVKGGAASYLMRVLPYRSISDVIEGVIITFVDISERKRAEEAQARLAAIVSSSQDAIVGHALDGTILSWNTAAEKIFGYPAAEAFGRPMTMLLPEGLQDELPRLIRRMRHGQNPTPQSDVARIKRGGEEIEVSLTVSPVLGADGKLIGASTIARDIGDRKRVEEERGRLAAIIEHADDAIVSKDLDGIIRTWNAGAERLFGYRAEEVIGKPITILMPEDRDDEESGILARIRRGEVVEQYDTVRRRKDGSLVDISLSVSPIRDAAGRVTSASKIAQDISVRRAGEAHREMLLHELSHRIKNTLATVQAIVAQTLASAPDPKTFQATFQARLVALSHAHELLMQGNWQGAALRELISRLLAPYRNDQRSQWTLEGKDIEINPKATLALGMVLHELATNAAKYGALSKPAGHVEVKWQVKRDGTLHLVWAERDGPRVEKPERRGFGSRLIVDGLNHELDADVQLEYKPTGLRCTIDVALEAVASERVDE